MGGNEENGEGERGKEEGRERMVFLVTTGESETHGNIVTVGRRDLCVLLC